MVTLRRYDERRHGIDGTCPCRLTWWCLARSLSAESRFGDFLSSVPYSVNPSLCSSGLNSHHTVCVILYMCTCVTDRDLESGCLVCDGSRKGPDVTCQRSTPRMTTSSTQFSKNDTKNQIRELSGGVWEQLHCFFFAGGGLWGGGGEDGLGPFTVFARREPGQSQAGARPEPGRSQAGATTGNPKHRRNSRVAPTLQRKGRWQWRQP